ncbi:hypothetical protein BB558_001571 [Smittium angustum]|uniref:SAM-dependent MTase RsmB/NOP-type domain-containing protein n=1 Tax=Smittium angustum TaxID=133377 RepID=A0A2U1JB15_SMIAN|nr:hypothetical protein BB558_001571 [Smittium angustum]
MAKKRKANVWKKNTNKRNRDDPASSKNFPDRTEDALKQNENFETYYKAQKIVPEEEWDSLISHLKRSLPTSFRVTGTRIQAEDLVTQIKRDFIPFIQNIEFDGVTYEPPHEIPWYPDGLGWSFEVPKIALKKSVHLNKFHKFLVTESEIGNISRQEAVSMIPPLLLDVKPNHAVLDMCAAPGSKTSQIIEFIHADIKPDEIPNGIVVANDSNYKRACMLVHQTNRLHSPCLIVTNHNGERFPNLFKRNKDDNSEQFFFDRILADVPCSGDGTMRKNPAIWNTWNFKEAIHLHKIQEKILKRAVHLVKVGGRIVYSTCSLNPIENEAVVASALNHYKGALELVDVSDELKNLIRRPGLSSWKVFDRDGVESNTVKVEDSEIGDKPSAEKQDEKNETKTLYTSLYPPKNSSELHLDRCLRIYPHLQNTGGFFVAVLKKTSALDATHSVKKTVRKDIMNSAAESDKIEDGSSDVAEEDSESDTPLATGTLGSVPLRETEYDPEKPRIDPSLEENPYVFLNPNEGSLKSAIDFYKISPKLNTGGFLARAEKSVHRTVYFVSNSVKELLSEPNNKLRMVNTGVKMLAKPASRTPNCEFRLVSEGVPILLPFIGSDFVVDMDFGDFSTFLKLKNPRFDQLSPSLSEVVSKTEKQISLIVRYIPILILINRIIYSVRAPIILPAWRGNDSLSIHIDKSELRSIIIRVLGVDADIGKSGFKMENNSRTSDKFLQEKKENKDI